MFSRVLPLTSTALLLGAQIADAVSVDDYISTEYPIAISGVLANIGPDGSKSEGALAGVVIASPNTDNPDYLYTWVRDASLTAKALIDQYTLGIDTSLRGTIDNFVAAEAIIQQIANPSGNVSTGGLGEPKFNVNETAFTGAWGRPQRDGPALRSTALITYANWLLSNNNQSYVTNTLWPMIELDLNYVMNYWNQSTFDLWEEIDSSSFFTTAVQHRALRQGSALATTLGNTSPVDGWNTQADNILCFLQSYWNPSGGYMTANTGGGRSGIDANTILASIHTFDYEAGCDANTFQPCSDIALLNLYTYVNSFRSIYAISSGISSTSAVGTGRYPEDVFMGGNPWYLTTLAVAEQLYDALYVWNKQSSIEVTSTSLPFFSQFSSGIAAGTYDSSSSTYSSLTSAISSFADGFVAIVAEYTPSDGGLAEEFSRTNGTPASALDLTWSYASAITAFAARANNVSASWGASGLTVPSVCNSNPGPTVNVTFNVDATTVEGQSIYISGSVNALSNWSPTAALLMDDTNYPTWSLTVAVPASSVIQYKYLKIDGSSVTWEDDPNDSITTPASGTYSTDDTWY